MDDTGALWDIITKSVYTNEFDYIRELIQNAIDATLLKIYLDDKENIEYQSPRSWHCNDKVMIAYSQKEGTLWVEDYGTGMNENELSNYLFKTANSGYKYMKKREFMFPAIAKFGIGFVACLTKADKIQILTRTQSDNGINAEIESTVIGMIAIGIGGISSAMWGSIVTVRYRKINFKRIVIEFVNIKQPVLGYLLVFMFLSIEFCYLLMGGMLQVKNWYIPVILFVKAILFGGIEEIGWRYTFQPIIEQQHNYVFSTCVTFVFWGIWHFLYFYIEGSIQFVQVGSFLLGLLINCFILSALYYKTKSLWICVMTHALINTLSQISVGGNLMVSMICKVIIICIAIFISRGVCINNEKRN